MNRAPSTFSLARFSYSLLLVLPLQAVTAPVQNGVVSGEIRQASGAPATAICVAAMDVDSSGNAASGVLQYMLVSG